MKAQILAVAVGIVLLSGCAHCTPPEAETARLKEEQEMRQQENCPFGDLIKEGMRTAVDALNR